MSSSSSSSSFRSTDKALGFDRVRTRWPRKPVQSDRRKKSTTKKRIKVHFKNWKKKPVQSDHLFFSFGSGLFDIFFFWIFNPFFFLFLNECCKPVRSDPKMVALGSTGFYWVRMVGKSFTGFYWVLLGFTGFHWVLLGFTGLNLVLLGFTGFWLRLSRSVDVFIVWRKQVVCDGSQGGRSPRLGNWFVRQWRLALKVTKARVAVLVVSAVCYASRTVVSITIWWTDRSADAIARNRRTTRLNYVATGFKMAPRRFHRTDLNWKEF